jgi:hypothetical protein
MARSFEMLHALVSGPAMVCPRWIHTRLQPNAVSDVVAALADLAERPVRTPPTVLHDQPLGFDDIAPAAPAHG